jgi:hypothetical protein
MSVIGLLALASSVAASAGTAGAPGVGASARTVVRLWFPDGGAPPVTGLCGTKIPPPFRCADGTATCERAIRRRLQGLLATTGADVEVEIASAAPGSDPRPGTVLTAVVSSGDASWCKPEEASTLRGLSPVNCAADARWGTTAYVFGCDRDARLCAVRIAQEIAHLVGLDHTDDPDDVMYPLERREARFVDREVPTVGARCGRPRQNSYRLLRARLGVAPAAVKERR